MKNHKITIYISRIILLLLITGRIISQTEKEPFLEDKAGKEYYIQPTVEIPVIDGKLDDPVWLDIRPIIDFVQEDPDNKDEYLKNAIENFTSASAINPTDGQTYTTLSKCYFDLGDKETAVNLIKTAVEKNPDDFNANFSAGQILLKCEKPAEEALPYFEKSVQLDPSNSNALRELASLYYDIDQKEKSIDVFQNAITNEEDKIVKANLYFNLGVIHNQMQNFEEAEKAFDEAFYLNEDDYEAALGMASSYEGLGDKYFNGEDGFEKDMDKAARWYRKAEKKIKVVKSIDFDNSTAYQQQLELIRYKRDIAEGN